MRILFPILLIGAAVAIFFGYTNNRWHEVQAKKIQSDKIVQAQKNADILRRQRDDLTEKFKSISPDDITKLSKMLPDSVENVGLIIEMDKIAFKDGMGHIKSPQINQGSVSKSGTKGVDSTKYGSLSMSFNVTGTYDQFKAFLKDLETYVRILDVVGISFTSTKEGRYTYNLTFQTYWLK